MTVATTTNRILYNADDSTVAFAFTFPITAESDMVVIHTDSSGVETTLMLTTHYAISASPWTSGGTVTTVATYATGETVLLKRVMPLTQATDYVENDPFPAETHEAALDKLTFVTQQIDEENDRAIKLPQSSAFTDLEIPEPESEKVLQWNAAADALQNVDVSSLGALVVTTPFSESLLDDISADAHWVTLMATITKATARSSLDVPSNSEAILDSLIDAAGDLIIGTAADTPALLPIGTAGQVLTVNSGATAPEWVTGAPVGSLLAMTDSTVPSGYLKLNGPTISMTTYEALYDYYGNAIYGLNAGTNFTADSGTDVITATSHGLSDDDVIELTNSGGALPNGLLADTKYFVITSTANTFQVSTTQGGAAVNFTDNGTGTHSFHEDYALPDFRGEFMRGWDDSAGTDPDAGSRTDRGDGTTGDNVGTKQADEFKAHTHTVDSSNNAGAKSWYGGTASGSFNSGSTGGNESRPTNINVMYCVKY